MDFRLQAFHSCRWSAGVTAIVKPGEDISMGRPTTAAINVTTKDLRKGQSNAIPAQSPPAAAPLKCHLLRLPGELRNRVYTHVLSHHPSTTTLTLHRDLSNPSVFRPLPSQPALARACRQLRHEVLALFFGSRTWDLDREIGTQDLVATWSRILQPSLWYVRSVRFELFSEYTASSPSLEETSSPLCSSIRVHAWLTDTNTIAYAISAPAASETCTCKFTRCARDVERGVLGSAEDAPLIRFLKAWDLPRPPVRGDRFVVCQGCGGGNVQVSLRDIRRSGRSQGEWR